MNTNAIIFCPSASKNNIRILNNYPKNINLIYANLQGMLEACHLDEFKIEIMKAKNLDFIAVCETWLRNRINSNKSVEIPGFKIYRSDRKASNKDKNKGGGVALYVKTGIKTKILTKSSNDNSIEFADYIFTECISKTGLIVIFIVYRTDKCNTENTFKLFNLKVESLTKYNDIIIVGDFNINILNIIFL